jgi:hypothetical protein
MVRTLLRLTVLGFLGLVTAEAVPLADAAPPKPPKRISTTTRRVTSNINTAARPGATRMYTVEARQPHWQHRTFTNRHAARTFYHRLAQMHVQRKIHHRANTRTWHVSFRARHWHRMGSTPNAAAARSMANNLRTRGFQARVR